MREFIAELTERGYQNRKIGFVENGTWTPTASKFMKLAFEKSKNITFAEPVVTIKSAMTPENEEEIAALAKEMK
jgi:flavorubredoxin